jgi:hypothetical protein
MRFMSFLPKAIGGVADWLVKYAHRIAHSQARSTTFCGGSHEQGGDGLALIWEKVKTLQNWEQKRMRPTGPARALMQIVAVEPKVAVRALYGQAA